MSRRRRSDAPSSLSARPVLEGCPCFFHFISTIFNSIARGFGWRLVPTRRGVSNTSSKTSSIGDPRSTPRANVRDPLLGRRSRDLAVRQRGRRARAPLALFVLMANATWLTFFTEAENLARHFVAASPAARAEFARLVSEILVVLFVCLCLSRLAALRHAAAPAALFSS
jgi:hypothetical protein